MVKLINLLLQIVITTVSLPSGYVDKPYHARVYFTGGTAPYSCSVPDYWHLPPGLHMKSTAYKDIYGKWYCLIYGDPTVAGTFGGITIYAKRNSKAKGGE